MYAGWGRDSLHVCEEGKLRLHEGQDALLLKGATPTHPSRHPHTQLYDNTLSSQHVHGVYYYTHTRLSDLWRLH